jgi:hypothetical protein
VLIQTVLPCVMALVIILLTVNHLVSNIRALPSRQKYFNKVYGYLII